MKSTTGRRQTGEPDGQRRANDRLWARKSLVQAYANRILRPVEVLLLARYRDDLSGRVLELACGAGRVSGYLAEISPAAHGIDLSPEMVAYCRGRYPKATFSQADLRDPLPLGDASCDAVVGFDNPLDVADDATRGRVLDEIHRVLRAGGLLVLSAHNLAYAPRLTDPLRLRNLDLPHAGWALLHWPRWQVNRRRVLRSQRTERGYSILNDISHDFMALHYYISRENQVAQLAAHGFELVECLDPDGERVAPADDAASAPWLHYVARSV